MAADAGITVLPQVTQERGAVKPEKLVAVGDTPFVSPSYSTVSRRPRFHDLTVFFEPGKYLGTVVDLHDPVDHRVLPGTGPTRMEYDPNYVFPGILVEELRHRVFEGLVLFQQTGLLKNLAAVGAGVDVVAEREEVGFG